MKAFSDFELIRVMWKSAPTPWNCVSTACASMGAAATAKARDRGAIRRMGTSPAQLYRLLDQTNYRKSVDQMIKLLQILDCEVDLVVRRKSA